MPGTVAWTKHVSENGPVRVCAECARAKPVRGVWYLVPARAEHPFLCESCFGAPRAARALS